MTLQRLIIPVLIFCTIAIYWQTGNHDFVNIDDPGYVYTNQHVMQGITFDSIHWALTSYSMGSWHPLTWLSHIADYQLYGLNPRGHHLTNVFLHTINAALLFIALRRLTSAIWQSAFVAFLFALHPFNVESVAWVSSRKDLLCALLFFLILINYSEYHKNSSRHRYGIMVSLFILGLLAKPMLVTLPLVLILIDYWPLYRFHTTPYKKLLLEKIPFALISLIFIGITVYTQQQSGVLADTSTLPLSYRIMNAATAYTAYIAKTFWPDEFIVLYPLLPEIKSVNFLVSLALLISISTAVFMMRTRFPFLTTGWLWFLGMLIPVIGFAQIGIQAMADRYSYLPVIGLFIIFAWGVQNLLTAWKHTAILASLMACLITFAMATASFHQIKHWQNSITLLRHATRHTSIPLLHNNLALALAEQGQFNEAITQLNKAIVLNPDYLRAYFNLGLLYEQQGMLHTAYKYYVFCIQKKPGDPQTIAALQRISTLPNLSGFQ